MGILKSYYLSLQEKEEEESSSSTPSDLVEKPPMEEDPPTYEAPELPHYLMEPFALPSPSDLLNDLQSAMEGLDSKDYAETYVHFQLGEYCGRRVVETLEQINSLKATMRYITESNSDFFTKKRERESQGEEDDPITLGGDLRRRSVFCL